MRTINVDIKPEPYQRSFFTQRERLSGMYSGRGVGKSWVMHNKACIALASGENVLYLTPTNSLLRKQMMPRMLSTLRSWGLTATWNKSDETISVDGSTGILWGASYRNYDDVCRGADGVSTVCYDELAKADDLPLLFAAVAPTMRGARFEPQTIYATTPRKGSQCDRMVLNNELGRVVTGATIDDNTHVTEAERENMKRFLKGDLYRQEIQGQILSGDIESAVFTSDCFGRMWLPPRGYASMGIDCAGHGRDYNVFYVIDDVHILEKVKVQKADSFEMNSIARGLIQKYKVRQVTVDGTGGYGQAIYDFLKLDPSLQVYFTNFGQSAEDHEHFANARAEMFFRLAEAMKLEFRLDDAETEEELRIISSDVNVSGKCILVSKDVIKKVLQRSPDSSDALALAYYNRRKMSTLDVAVNSMYKKMRMF
jgi:hypothetical protein